MTTTTIDSAEPTNIWAGVFWKISSCALFAGINVLVRYLSGGSTLPVVAPLPVYMIMFFQSCLAVLFLLTMTVPNNSWQQLLTLRHGWLHFIRVTTAVAGIGVWYLSFQHMPLAEVVGLSFAGPALTIVGAVLILRERLTWQRIVTFTLSTLGIFFISRPDLKLQDAVFNWIMLLPIIATAMFALDKIALRKLLAANENPLCTTILFMLFMAVASLLPCMAYGWVTPDLSHWPWLILLAALGSMGHFSFSKAYHYAEVTTLIPFSMSKIIFCSLAGYLAFGEYPNSWETWLGIIILTSCTMVFKYKPEVRRL